MLNTLRNFSKTKLAGILIGIIIIPTITPANLLPEKLLNLLIILLKMFIY